MAVTASQNFCGFQMGNFCHGPAKKVTEFDHFFALWMQALTLGRPMQKERKKSSYLGGSELDDLALQQTISSTTAKQYLLLYKRMYRDGMRHRNCNAENSKFNFTNQDLVSDLLDNRRRVKYGTLLKMRSELLNCIAGENAEELRVIMRSVEFMELLRKSGGSGLKNSRTRGRFIPEEDYLKIVEKLGTMKGWAKAALLLLRATVATGARQSEWANACWKDQSRGILCLQNAKEKTSNALNRKSAVPNIVFKEGRDLPVCRFVIVDMRDVHVVNEQILAIRRIIDADSAKSLSPHATFDRNVKLLDPFFDTIRYTLGRVCEREVGHRYSIYDARSTFASNRRARDGMQSASAELGHSATKTGFATAAHYANRYKAWGAYKIVSKDELAQKDKDTHVQAGEDYDVPSF